MPLTMILKLAANLMIIFQVNSPTVVNMNKAFLYFCAFLFVGDLFICFDRPNMWSIIALPLMVYALRYLEGKVEDEKGKR